MNTTMQISLTLSDDALKAVATISIDQAIQTPTFSFVLNDELHIAEILCNGNPADYEVTSTIEPPFRPLCKAVTVKGKESIRDLSIRYHGRITTGWHTGITRDIVSISMYSAWFPQETTVAIDHDRLILQNGQDYVVVKGEYDENAQTWAYGDRGFDPFNLVAFRRDKAQVVSNPFLNITFVDEAVREPAERSGAICRRVIEFLNGDLFAKRELPVWDMPCVYPLAQRGGGYIRNGLLWCSLPGDELSQKWYFAHEIAHTWCMGAEVTTWEDWLNETTAEWAALLFARHIGDDALFELIINAKLSRADGPRNAIHTPDGSRPFDTHDRGTLLFYDMSQELGLDAVRKVVRLFTDLETKTTAALLQTLRAQGETAIADFIATGIEK